MEAETASESGFTARTASGSCESPGPPMTDPISADPVTESHPKYGPMVVWSAEGARVGLVTCRDCGAAIVVDPRDKRPTPMELHDEWHQSEEYNRDR